MSKNLLRFRASLFARHSAQDDRVYRVLSSLLKAEFAGAIVYFFLPGFAVAKSCFANHTSIALFIIRLVITEYVVFTIM